MGWVGNAVRCYPRNCWAPRTLGMTSTMLLLTSTLGWVLSTWLPFTRGAFCTPPEDWLTSRVIVHVLVRVDLAGGHCVVYDWSPRMSANVKLTSLQTFRCGTWESLAMRFSS